MLQAGLLPTQQSKAEQLRWLAVFAATFSIHAGFLGLVHVEPRPPHKVEEPVQITLNLDDPTQFPGLEEPLPEPESRQAIEEEDKTIPPPSPAVPQDPMLPEPEREESKKKDKEEPAEAPIDPGAFDRIDPNTAFDTAEAQEEAPKEARYLGDKNTEAADRGPKDLPKGDPYMAGESREVRSLGRRGETEEKVRVLDATAGSVKKQGTPEPGQPEEDLAKTDAAGLETETKDVTDKRPVPPDKIVVDTPASPAAPQSIEEKRPESQGAPLAETEPPPAPGPGETVQRKPNETVDATVPDVPLLTEKTETQPSTQTPVQDSIVPRPVRKDETIDPEMQRLNAILSGDKKPKGPVNNQDQPGIWARPDGEAGHEGDGRVRPGESEAVMDIVTMNLKSSAARLGDAAFAKKADPKTAYLKKFFQRVDAKWKANLSANTKVRVEIGTVGVRVTVNRNGTLKDVHVVKRSGDLSDLAVVMCRSGVREAGPLAPFPPNLGERERLTFTINFLYR